jgi:hypothetical protein
MSLTNPKLNDPVSMRQAIQQLSLKLGPGSVPTFAGLTVTNCCVLGSDSVVFQPNADSTTFFQVKDAAGTSVLNADTTNKQVTIGYTSAAYPFLIKSTDASDQIQIYHDNANANVTWNDGRLVLESAEGDNAVTSVRIYGHGTGAAFYQLLDGGSAAVLTAVADAGHGQIYTQDGAKLRLQHSSGGNVECFDAVVEGGTPEFITSGFRTGDAKRSLEIGVGVDAADTASFDGVSKYWFDGSIGISTDPTARLHLPAGTATASTAPLKFTSGTALTTPEAGAMEFCGNCFSITESVDRRVISVASDSIVTSTSHATDTETAIFTAPISANDLRAGEVIRLHASGKISTDDVAAVVTVRVKIGGVTIVTLASTAKVVTDEPWHLWAYMTIRTIGAAGTVSGHGHIMIEDTEVHTNTSSQALDTTAVSNVTITAQWAATDADDVITIDQGFMEVLV